MDNFLNCLHTFVKDSAEQVVGLRSIFQFKRVGLALKQVMLFGLGFWNLILWIVKVGYVIYSCVFLAFVCIVCFA
ncbi:hypothetical protein HanPI659440_Chr00c01g0704011 [Helianthus annuus]|nr:hypothetical protein HanPI659440_Chr00c01g0704011 [Helianthus annuus]